MPIVRRPEQTTTATVATAPVATSTAQTVVEPVPPQQSADSSRPGGGGGGGGGGADRVGSGTAGAGESKPQDVRSAPSETLGPGTGFVNIDRLLAANQGIGADVAKAGKSAIEKEANSFNTAFNTAMTGATGQTPTQVSDETIGRVAGGAISHGGGAPSSSGSTIYGSDRPDLTAITAALAGEYKGPTQIQHNMNQSADTKTAKALANNQTTGRVLAQQAGMVGGMYTPQLSAIDAALYGQVGDAISARSGITQDIASEKARQGAQTGVFNATVEGQRQALADNAADVRNRLQNAGMAITNSAQQQANAANAADTALMQTGGSGLMLDPGNEWSGDARWEAGPAATAGNFINSNQAYGLSNLAQLLNDPSLALQSTGPYQGGHWARDQYLPVPDLPSPTEPITTEAQKAEAERMRDQIKRSKVNEILRGMGDRRTV